MTMTSPSKFFLPPSWQEPLHAEMQKPYMSALAEYIESERASEVPIYPTRDLVFNALEQTPFDNVKVVVVGQDPYHGPGQAHGMCFSVSKGIKMPPSLQNIFKEAINDVGIPPPPHGCLLSWAQQGVLMLNATLTVRQGKPMSHHGMGWETFTDAIISALCVMQQRPLIFVLWGKSAQEKFNLVRQVGQSKHHYVLKAAHPSPFSAHNGFFGCRHFSKINGILAQHGLPLINWTIQ